MSFIYLYIAAAFFIFLSSLEFPGICRVQWKSVFAFIFFMIKVTIFRMVLQKLTGFPHVDSDPASPMNTIQLWTVMGVYWEDTFFTLPILVLERLNVSKFITIPLLILNSISFASGHIGYGSLWALITILYVPFISYRYGKKNGLGTVMLCHILYDLITLLTVRHLMS